MAKSHRSSTSIPFQAQSNAALQKQRAKYVSSLYEIFDHDAEDPKGWLLTWAESVAHDASIDPYPYVFFNLLLAVLVALQGPLFVMSQNRQSLKDRAEADTDFKVNLKNEVNIETVLRELGELRAEGNARLERIEATLAARNIQTASVDNPDAVHRTR